MHLDGKVQFRAFRKDCLHRKAWNRKNSFCISHNVPQNQAHLQNQTSPPGADMKNFCLKLSLLLGMLLLALPGCRHQTEAKVPPAPQASDAARTPVAIHQGSLHIPHHVEAPRVVYVDARAAESHAPHLRDHLAEALRKSKFRLADTPSKAGYILHVQILKDGQIDPQSLKSAVQAGYGKKSSLKGGGTRALLVDALMVQRRIPSAKRPSRQQMKNISSRNALGSNRMRLAVYTPASGNNAEDFSRALARELALRME